MKQNFLARFIGTSFFTGYIPLGPGTFASILALSIVFLLHKNTSVYIITTLAVLIIGTISAHHLSVVWQKKDDQRITVDEFAGIFITFLLIPKINWYMFLIGFVLFRIFDIFKPFGIRQTERINGGLGIMFDDVLSGIYANIVIRIFSWII